MTKDQVQSDLLFSQLSARDTVRSVVAGFLLARELENCTPATMRYYRTNLERFLWYAEQPETQFPERFSDVTTAHIRGFISYVQNGRHRWGSPDHSQSSKPTSPRTVQVYRAVLHTLWQWAVDEEIVEYNVVARVRAPKQETKMQPSPSEGDIKKLIDHCRHATGACARRDLAIVVTMLDTGVRASELCGVTLSDWQERRLKVYGKGRRERWLPLSPLSAKAIWDYVQRERPQSYYDHLFLTLAGEPMRVDTLESMLDRRAKAAGVICTPHQMRRAFAISWAASGGPLNALQALLGHSTPHMSLRYGRMASTEAAELHRQYSPVERLGLRLRERKPPPR